MVISMGRREEIGLAETPNFLLIPNSSPVAPTLCIKCEKPLREPLQVPHRPPQPQM